MCVTAGVCFCPSFVDLAACLFWLKKEELFCGVKGCSETERRCSYALGFEVTVDSVCLTGTGFFFFFIKNLRFGFMKIMKV